MIRSVQGDLLAAEVEALVNPVNCVGIMGRGLALQFRRTFPENFAAYKEACRRKQVQPGVMFIVKAGQRQGLHHIINFPTKRHWRDRSRMEDIETGLTALVAAIHRLQIRSIAVPPLGCGLGGLDWEQVRTHIERALEPLEDVQVLLYAPSEDPGSGSAVEGVA